MRDSFAFYRSFLEAIEQLPTNLLKAKAYKVICEYGLDKKEVKNNDNIVIKLIFTQAKPQLDKSLDRYNKCVKNGQKGGAPKNNKNALRKKNNNQQTTNKQPREEFRLKKNNLNDNDNDNDNDNVNDKERDKSLREKSEAALVSLSHKYINLKINIKFLDCVKYNFEKIDYAINQSDYLQNATLSFILENYEKVINGNYQNFSKSNLIPEVEQVKNLQKYERREFEQIKNSRQYDSQDLNNLIDKVEDINFD